MKKLIISLMPIPVISGMASCNEIGENGSIDWEQWKADSEAAKNLPVYQTYTLNHPCLLHTQDDIDFVRRHIGEEPYATALTKLKANSHAQPDYTPHPVTYLTRLDANNWSQMGGRWEDAGIADLRYSGIHNNYTHFMNDAAAAYQLALRYVLEDDAACAVAARSAAASTVRSARPPPPLQTIRRHDD